MACYHARCMKAILKRHGTVTRATWVGVLWVGLLVLSGCAEGPRRAMGRAMDGARFYSAGTRSLEAGDAATAVAELSRAADLVPHASEIQNHLGMAYWTLGELSAAESAFDQALVLDCENEAARLNRERLITERAQTARTQEGTEHGG